MMFPLRIFLARVCIGGALLSLLISAALYIQRISPYNLSFQTYTASSVSAHEYLPTQLSIKDLHILLPVVPAQITNTVWETTFHGVSYLSSSPVPGNTGNSILYGHNWQSLLGRLVNAKVGQRITIQFSNHTQKTFRIVNTQIVSLEDVSVLQASDDARITLYTCTGFLDSKRFVVTAVLEQ